MTIFKIIGFGIIAVSLIIILKNQKPEEKTEVKQLSASDFFAGTFNSSVGSQPQPSAIRRSSMPDVSSSFTNIEIPDFLKK